MREKRKPVQTSFSVKLETTCITEEDSAGLHGATLDKKLSDIRRQIVKWQRKEKTDENLKWLQERKE